MKYFHCVSENCAGKDRLRKELFKQDLDKVGFAYEYTEDITGRWVRFEISQTDPSWPLIQEILQRHDIKPSNAKILFTETELLAVDYLYFGAILIGYPQPEDDFGYVKTTYDGAGCEDCGMGYSQTGLFRIKEEPRWGRRGIMGLNWVFDELFVRPEIWREVFEPFGIKCRPVLKYKKETELETVVQLDIRDFSSSSINMAGLIANPCHVCGRSRYYYPRYEPYPSFNIPQSLDLFKTQEYFGDGGASHQWIVVSQEMYRLFKKKQVRGVHFVPMVDDPQEYIRTHLE
jgi:hypothetical protein